MFSRFGPPSCPLLAGCGTGHNERGRVDRRVVLFAPLGPISALAIEFKPQADLIGSLPFRYIPDINICLVLTVQPRVSGVRTPLSSDKPQKSNVAKSAGAAA